jgi:hypothetical protein
MTYDTVLWETPDSRATSLLVGTTRLTGLEAIITPFDNFIDAHQLFVGRYTMRLVMPRSGRCVLGAPLPRAAELTVEKTSFPRNECGTVTTTPPAR